MSKQNEDSENKQQIEESTSKATNGKIQHVQNLSNMYENWFLDYASYVILERAVPHLNDGLKPVQRRIMHAMKKMDDGRYNKVANIIGSTMQYHPHGDASIGDALVGLGQKDLLIDTQGNWGNILTGDSSAAPRYIEARLSKFALETAFNAKTTRWKQSYDGRNKEPVNLPMKFPLLLAQGVEGIAVGLASKILPHNFIELINASIGHLKGEDFELVPDFPTGGLADFSKYNDGLQGGKVRVRARIKKLDNKTLVIDELPFGKTTVSLIESILLANDKGKIKIKKIEDNTSDKVEIQVHIHPGSSPDKTIDALYAFTDCELSISPNSCVIKEDKPVFLGVKELLRNSTQNTLYLLQLELTIRKHELEELWHLSSLEKIFIENRIYNHIEECETWESIIETIDKGLEPFKSLLWREVTHDDIVRLTEIKIKRISKYDSFKSDEYIKSLEAELEEVKYHLEHIVPYTIAYYTRIREKYGKGRERKTEIRSFHIVEATQVAAANQRLYVNRKEGFVGTSLKKDEFVGECSDIDDVIVFLKEGRYSITKVDDKSFVGKNIVHVAIFKRNDDRTIYNTIYQDGKEGSSMVKRFYVTGVTRDKEYDLTKGTPNSRILYFSANPNGEAERVKIFLKPKKRLRNLQIDFDFSEITIKGRHSQGNILTRHSVERVNLKEKGISTLGGVDIWFDPSVVRINSETRGRFLGNFSGDDRIITLTQSGHFQLHSFDPTTVFDDDTILIEKYDPEKVYNTTYFDADQEFYYLKRFLIENGERKTQFIGDNPQSKLVGVSNKDGVRFEITFGGKYAQRPVETIDAEEFIAVKSFKARGKRLTTFTVGTIKTIEPQPPEQEETQIPSTDENSEQESYGYTSRNIQFSGIITYLIYPEFWPEMKPKKN